MKDLSHLLERNRQWAARTHSADESFFARLSRQQAPDYLWIGCSDSRVPANEIVGLTAGELFVHRNVANQVADTDMNGLSVLQFGVDALQVEHIIVCGHYGCGGVRAAIENQAHGPIDKWLTRLRRLYEFHKEDVDQYPDEDQRVDRLCELNVQQQVLNVARTPTVRDAWARGQKLVIHGWIYCLSDGLLKDMGVTLASQAEADRADAETP